MTSCKHPDGCGRPVKGHGWCRTHLDRVRRTGDPGVVAIEPRQPLGRPCVRVDCDKPVTNDAGYGMCSTHYQRWRKHGSPDVVATSGASLPLDRNPNWAGDRASYSAVHLRLRRHLGSAAAQRCVDCEKAAAHWSYDNADPDESVDPVAGRYSTKFEHYVPRCVPCHKAFDAAHRSLQGATS